VCKLKATGGGIAHLLRRPDCMKLVVRSHNFLLALAIVASLRFAGAEEAPGVPNFHQVNQQVFRGAQPTKEGWNSLAKLGVKVVIDLRQDKEGGEHLISAEAKAVQEAGMRYVNVPLKGIVAPSDDQIAKILIILNGPDPVFVHCRQGKDRTGVVIACYRIAHDRWDSKRAMGEAKAIGMHWKEVGMKRYISHFTGVGMSTAPVAENTVVQSEPRKIKP